MSRDFGPSRRAGAVIDARRAFAQPHRTGGRHRRRPGATAACASSRRRRRAMNERASFPAFLPAGEGPTFSTTSIVAVVENACGRYAGPGARGLGLIAALHRITLSSRFVESPRRITSSRRLIARPAPPFRPRASHSGAASR
ncbi:hypothetical protein WT60_22070 [Burkholderia sp. MSMB617WGS]|nr:hypothetical protein WT60_22070 [Burkholderia sp. MSMB617WGS]